MNTSQHFMTVKSNQAACSTFRFAPSPNGRLHLGHAYCALKNEQIATELGAVMLLRIEDIDLTRCTPELEQAIYEDLEWLGFEWQKPVRRQSEHFEDYAAALERLIEQGLAYPTAMTRGEIKAHVNAFEESGKDWPRDPDGAPIYPGIERDYSSMDRIAIIQSGKPFAWRLDMKKALRHISQPLFWSEAGDEDIDQISADPATWGDVVLSRSDAASSYHLSVVVDDALQGITHVVRGQDLYNATSIHRLLQVLLSLPAPNYHHHRLILDHEGHKLSKSNKSTALFEMREAGMTPLDVRSLVGF
jgi:glutamyl-Q tRNA(Asp) synthetase